MFVPTVWGREKDKKTERNHPFEKGLLHSLHGLACEPVLQFWVTGNVSKWQKGATNASLNRLEITLVYCIPVTNLVDMEGMTVTSVYFDSVQYAKLHWFLTNLTIFNLKFVTLYHSMEWFMTAPKAFRRVALAPNTGCLHVCICNATKWTGQKDKRDKRDLDVHRFDSFAPKTSILSSA